MCEYSIIFTVIHVNIHSIYVFKIYLATYYKFMHATYMLSTQTRG